MELFSMIFLRNFSKVLRNIHEGGMMKAYEPFFNVLSAIICTKTVARSAFPSSYSSFAL